MSIKALKTESYNKGISFKHRNIVSKLNYIDTYSTENTHI